MSRRSFTLEEKSAVARGWEKSGLGQSEYARQHGISDPLLRAWRREHVPGRRWEPEVRDAVRKAVTTLTGVLKAMEPDTVQGAANLQVSTALAPQVTPTFRFDAEDES